MIMRKKSMRAFFFVVVLALLGAAQAWAQETSVTCPKPVDLQLVGASQTTATLGWQLSDVTLGTPAKYLLTVRQGETVIHQGLVINDPTGTRQYQITGLTAATAYTVTLQTDCTDDTKGKSEVSDEFTFSTLCQNVTLPYTADFESKDAPLNCWMTVNTGHNTKIATRTYHGDASSGQSAYMNASSKTMAYLVSPQFDFAANNMEVSFWYHASANVKFTVGVIADPYDVSSYVALYADSVATTKAWTEVRFNTSAYADALVGRAIAIMIPSGTSTQMYIDDFSVKEKPACARPERLTVSAIDSTSVTLSWVDYENAGSYEVQVGEQTPVAVTTNPYTVVGLEKGTAYSFKVRTTCAAGTQSEWSASVDVTTRCGVAPSAAFEQYFDDQNTLPTCWYQEKTKGAGIWDISTKESNSGRNSLRFHSDLWGTDSRTLLVMQPIEVATAGQYDLSFMMYRKESSYYRQNGEGVRVWVSNKPDITDASAVELGMIHNEIKLSPAVPSEGFYPYEYNIPLTGKVYIIIEGINLNKLDTYIDDFKVYEAPKCRPVSNIRVDKDQATLNSVTFVWNRHPASTATQYLVDFTITPASSAAVTVPVTVTGEAYTITGLTPSTTYTITTRVATTCGADGDAAYVEQNLTATTRCEAVLTFPIKEGFESAEMPPACWSTKQTVLGEGSGDDFGDNAWVIADHDANYSDQVYAGSYAAKMQLGIAGTHNILVMPLADFGTVATDYTLRFQLLQFTSTSHDQKLNVWVNSTPDTIGGTKLTSISLEDAMIDNWDDFEWRRQEVNFNAQGEKYIVFEGVSAGSDYYKVAFFIDDVMLFPTPDCEFLDVTKVSADSVGSDAIRFAISDPMIVDWSVSVCAAGTNPDFGTIVRATGQSVTVTGLTPDTQYDYYVKLHCKGGAASGLWSETSKTVKTDCLPYAITEQTPFFEGFEDFTHGSALAGCYSTVYTGSRCDYKVSSYYDAPEGEMSAYVDMRGSGNQGWIMRSVSLQAGKNYCMSMMARQEYDDPGYIDAVLGYGSVPKSDSMTIASRQTIVNGEWNEYNAYFAVPADGVYYVGFGADYVGYAMEMYYDSLTVKVVDCVPPINVQIANVTATSATIAFESASTEWDLKVSSIEFDPTLGAADVFNGRITSKSYNLADLMSNANYYYTLRSYCDGEPSEWLPLQKFRTLCADATIPYEDNFDDPDGNSLYCWEFMDMGYSAIFAFDDTYARSGYSLVVGEAVAVSPVFDITSLADYELSGWALLDGYGPQSFIIGVLNSTDPDDFEATFLPLATINLNNGKTWYDFSVRFDSIATALDSYDQPFSGAKRFAIYVNGDYRVYLENLELTPKTSCVKPQNLAISDITAHSVTATWEAGAGETEWQLVLKQNDERIDAKVVTATTTGTIDGLTPLTDYELYIASICGAGDTTGLRYIGEFTTSCGIFTLPYDNNFGGSGEPQCWTDGLMIPTNSANGANMSKNQLAIEIDDEGLSSYYTPWFAYTAGDRIRVSFDMIFNKNEGDSVGFYILENDGQTVKNFANKVGMEATSSSSVRHYEYEITSLLSGNYSEFRFVFGLWSNNWGFTAYISNFTIERILPNSRPQGVTFDSIGIDAAKMTILDTATIATAWQYAVVETGASVATATVADAPQKTFTVTGLTARTMYDVYVRTSSGTIPSDWRGPITFRTNCPVASTPYYQDFENETSIETSCFTTLEYLLYDAPKATVNSYGNGYGTGERCLEFTSSYIQTDTDGKPGYSIVVFPPMEEPANTLAISFDYKTGGTEPGKLSVGVINDPTNASSYLEVAQCPASAGYSHFTAVFSDINERWANGQIAIRALSGNRKSIYIDNIALLPADYCFGPESVELLNFGDTFASVRFVTDTNRVDRQYRLETLDGTLVLEGVTNDTIAADTINFTALTAGTDYIFKVRTMCTAENPSDWKKLQFRTVNATPSFPYTTGFEDDADNALWINASATEVNHFMFGSDATAVREGTKALYVTDDDASNHYSSIDASVSYMYRTFHFTAGQYLVSYDWKGVGDYSSDYARVFLSSIFSPIESGKFGASGDLWRLGDDFWNPLSDNKISDNVYSLDGGKILNRRFDWTQQLAELTIESDTFLNLVVAWRNNAASGVQTPFTMDNLSIEKVNCPTLDSVRISALTDNQVVVSYRNMHAADSVIYAVSRTANVADAFYTDSVEGRTITVDNLAPATEYYIFVRTKCDAVRNSAWRSVKATTLREAAAVPYQCGFENDEENAMWQVAAGVSDVNKFVIGTATHSGTADAKSLYISNDATSYDYSADRKSTSYAYRLFDLEAGLYDFGYDWKCGGGYADYARLFLAPADVVVTPGANLFSSSSLADGCIALDEKEMSYQTDWKRTNKQELVSEAGKYCLVLAWTNDDNQKTTPVAVDSIVVAKLPCAPVIDFALDTVSTDMAQVSFVNINESRIEYAIHRTAKTAADVPAADFITSADVDSIRFESLRPNTAYTLFIRALCSDTDQSAWAAYQFSTECTPVVVTAQAPYTTSFEDYAGQFGLGNCWTESNPSYPWSVNSLNVSENRAPRTGQINIVNSSNLGVVDVQNASRSFQLTKGKYYAMSIWGITDGDRFAEMSFVHYGATEDVVLAKKEANSLSYTNMVGYFKASADSVYDLGFRIANANTYFAMDDYSVTEVPFGAPINLTADDITKTSALVSWVANADSARVVVTYRGTTIFDQTTTGTSVLLSGLTAATNYTVTVTAFLGTEASDLAQMTFFTDCDVMALPYMQSFQDAYGTEIPACWDRESATVIADRQYNWNVSTEGNAKYARLSTSGAYGVATLLSPSFNVDADGYALSFRYANTSEIPLVVKISADGGATYTQLASLTAADWATQVYPLADYVGKTVIVAFEAAPQAQGTGLYIAIDDVRLACYGGSSTFTGSHCSGSDYYGNGFVISRADLKLGTNTYTRLVMADIASDTNTACDTLKEITLTVTSSKETHRYATICEGQTYNEEPFVGQHSQSVAGDYVMTFDATSGCDSNVILHLKVLPQMYYTSATICEGDTYEFAGMQCDTAGTYVAYGKNHLGCDSNVTLRLEVTPSHYYQYRAVCEGTVWEWKEAGITLNETREYSHVFKTAERCDSIVVIDFHVIPTETTDRRTICAGSSIIFGEGANAEEISTAGEYTKTYKNSLGCDSVVHLILRVNDPIVNENDDYVCQDYPYTNYGFNIPSISKDTVLTRTIKNNDGCDSTIIVNVEFLATVYTDTIATIQQGGQFEFCGTTYTTAGEYTCHERSVETGCDSVVRLTLNVITAVDQVNALPLIVAPNPVSGGDMATVNRDWTFAEQQGMTVEMLNSIGQVVWSTTPEVYPIQVPTTKVSGLYYVRITDGTGRVYVGKLIVK